MLQTFNMLPDGALIPPYDNNHWREGIELTYCLGSHVNNDNGDTQYCFEETFFKM